MRVINNSWLFVGLIFLFLACNKDKDNGSGPEVTWTSPSEGTTFFSVDTIPIIASIQSENKITRVSVKLTNQDGSSLASMGDVYPNSTSYQLSKAFELYRPDLLGGALYLQLEAFDEKGKSSHFRGVNLLPIPWEVRASAVAYGSGNNRTVAVREDGVWSDIFSGGGDVKQLLGNHLEGLLFVISGQSGKVHALEYPEYTEKWTFEIPNNTTWRSIESAAFNAEIGELMVADTDQLVRVVNKEGNTILGFDTNLPLHLPVKAMLTPNRLYLIERRIDNSSQSFSVFFKSSGALDSRVALNGNVVAMFEQYSMESLAEHDEVVVFVNDNSTPRLRVYERFTQGFTDPIGLPGSTITAACKIGPRRYLFQIDGTIYQFNFTGPLSIYYSGDEYNDLVFDPVQNQVHGIRPDGIQVMGFSGNGLQDVGWWPQSQTVDFTVLRNR